MVEKIICKLGCIYFHVNLQTGDYCCPQGDIPKHATEGTECQRGYTQSDMDKILEQERKESALIASRIVESWPRWKQRAASQIMSVR